MPCYHGTWMLTLLITGYVTMLLLLTVSSVFSLSDSDGSNLALNKRTFQGETHGYSYSSLAVDGSRYPNLLYKNSCTRTTSNESIAWWYVDLELPHLIVSLIVTTHPKNSSNKLSNFTIEISKDYPETLEGFPGKTNSSVCVEWADPIPEGASYQFNCPSPIVGQYVRIFKFQSDSPPDSDDNSTLAFCEVEIYGPRSRILEKEYTPVSVKNAPEGVVEVLTGIHSAIQCGLLCVGHVGLLCNHILYSTDDAVCQLIHSLVPWEVGMEMVDGMWEVFNLDTGVHIESTEPPIMITKT